MTTNSPERTMAMSTQSSIPGEAGEQPLPGADADGRWHETLSDGTRVLIRRLGSADAELERTFLERLSPESRAFRFLGQVAINDEMIRRLTDIDGKRDVAFVALHRDEGEKREIGVSRFSVSVDGTSCECAVAVSDEWQGRGLGMVLMRHLIDVARQRGIRRMFSVDSIGNRKMHELAASLGFERATNSDYPGEVVHTLVL